MWSTFIAEDGEMWFYLSNSPTFSHSEFAKRVLKFYCKACGDPVSAQYIKETKERLLRDGLCFRCDYWFNRFYNGVGPDEVYIDGRLYTIENDDLSMPSHLKGHGGWRFKVEFFDGRVVETTNLWLNGHVPGHFLHLFPDNARFIHF